MFNINNNNNKKENPFTKFKNKEKKEDIFGFETEDEYIEHIEKNNKFAVFSKKDLLFSEEIYTRNELSNLITLENFEKFMINNKNQNGFIKLCSLKIDEKIRRLIKLTMPARELVVELNDLPEYMKRSDNSLTELKCQATEIPMSDLLRKMNKFSKVKLQTPAINTLTPEKDKPDYIFDNKVFFDMKGQVENRPVNINKIAHDRAVEQGLSYYMIGILNSDNIDSLTYVTYYLLPLGYMFKNAKLISNGNYQDNPRNNYYTIKIDNVINYSDI